MQLSDLVLKKAGAQREVDMAVRVDDVPGAALSVVSQGELNALALSLFLPRATMDESPFRFLVIDDPVQAMDPARVNGLATVLGQIAVSRQVIVLTHDDRLPAAVRRLEIPATVFEVTRKPGSIIEIRKTPGLAQQQLNDAWALAKSDTVTDAVKAYVVPGLCRSALEIACADVFRRRRIGRGEPHSTVDAVLDSSKGTMPLMALALFDDTERAGEVLVKLKSWDNRLADAFQAARKGTHAGYAGSLVTLVNDCRSLHGRIEQLK